MAVTADTRPPPRRPLLIGLQVCVSLALVAWLVTRFDFSRAVSVVGQADLGFVLAGFASSNAVMALVGFRFGHLLRKGGLPLPWGKALMVAWVGQFWSFFLPGSTGGDVYRLGVLWAAHPARKADAAVAVFADRLVATAMLGVFACAGLLVLPLVPVLRGWWAQQSLPALPAAAVWILGAGLMASAVLLFLASSRGPARSFLASVWQRLVAGRIFFVPDPRLLGVLALALLGHLVNFFAFYCYAQSVGLEVSFGQVCLVLPLVLLFLIVPISINGHGLREALLVLLLTAIGVQSTGDVTLLERIIALSVVGLSAEFVMGLGAGLFFLYLRLGSGGPAASGSRGFFR